jgi:hypothetical protein
MTLFARGQAKVNAWGSRYLHFDHIIQLHVVICIDLELFALFKMIFWFFFTKPLCVGI